jgi:hypothetical protein
VEVPPTLAMWKIECVLQSLCVYTSFFDLRQNETEMLRGVIMRLVSHGLCN